MLLQAYACNPVETGPWHHASALQQCAHGDRGSHGTGTCRSAQQSKACSAHSEQLHALRQARQPDKVEYLLRQLQPQNVKDYNVAITACDKSGQWQRALLMLPHMRIESLSPNVISFTAAISACQKGQNWQQAVLLLEEMQAVAVMPDVIILNSVISLCGKSKQWQRALAVLQEIRDAGMNPDIISFTAAISACQHGGHWEQALSVLNQIHTSGLTPEVASFNAAISACEKAGQWQQALSLLEKLREASPAPNAISFSTAILACEKDGQWQCAGLLLEKMRSAGVTPDLTSFNAALRTCEKVGQWENVLLLLEQIHAAGMMPDESTYATSIPANEIAGQWHQVLLLFEKMCVGGVEPNLMTLSAAVSACKQEEIWDHVLLLLQEMRLAGLTPSVISMCAAILASRRDEQWQQTLSLLQGGRQVGNAPAIVRSEVAKPRAEDLQLAKRILYEDDDVIVINKPMNCLVHPDGDTCTGTLVNGLTHYLESSGCNLDWAVQKGEWAGIVHRLDKDTSGCIVVAKNAVAHAILSRSFAEREVRKQYICVSYGKPVSSQTNVRTLIGQHPSFPWKMAAMPVGAGHQSGKPAESTVVVLGCDEKFSLLQVAIHTGRTHQIRVHLQHLQIPIVGDEVYGLRDRNSIARKRHGISRPLLHALSLSFPHPMFSDKIISVKAPPPEDFHMIAGHIIEGLSPQTFA